MNAGPHWDKVTNSTINHKNWHEQGIHGLHVGLPCNCAGWLVYVPSTGQISISADVQFDEDFLSTLALSDSCIPGGLQLQAPHVPVFSPHHTIHTTEDPGCFTMNDATPG